jgi:hypothetical protein
MKISQYLILIITAMFLTSCGLVTDVYQKNQRKVLDYLLSDLPLPRDAEILKEPSVVLGTGNAISARIVLSSNYSPAENLIFYGNETPTTGWSLLSSKVGEEIDLIYTKEGRYATIHMEPKSGLRSFVVGDYATDVVISVVHPDAIANQNPYEGLDYQNLPGSPEPD